MGMLQLQQPEVDIIAISDINIQGTQTAENARINTAGPEPLPINQTKPGSVQYNSLPSSGLPSPRRKGNGGRKRRRECYVLKKLSMVPLRG